MDGEVAVRQRNWFRNASHSFQAGLVKLLTQTCGGDRWLAEYLWRVAKVKAFRRQLDLLESCLPLEKQEALKRCLESVRDVPGDVVECGVYRGGGTVLMAATLKRIGSRKSIHGFDSFEGLPEHSRFDTFGNGGVHYSKGVLGETSVRLVHVKVRVHGFGHVVRLHKGYFEDSVPRAFRDGDQFSFVLVDCDQYGGTKFCMEYFYDRVNPGGVIVVDDYFLPEGADTPGVKTAVDEFMRHRPERLEHLALSMYGFRRS